jgi:hypothetical protein
MGLTKAIMTRYPCVDGLIAGTTTQTGHQENLIPEEGSLVSQRDKVGM